MHRSYLVLMLLSVFLIGSVIHAQTPVSGAVAGTWTTAGSPYQVTDGIIINAGTTLTIQPGVEVHFQIDSSLIVQGTLNVSGTETDSVLFTIDNNFVTEFAGIRFLSGSAGSISYAIIEFGFANGLTPENQGGGIYCNGASPTISFSTIRNCRANTLGGGICLINSTAIIEFCTITNDSSRFAGGIYVNGDATISGNRIFSNVASSVGGGLNLDISNSPEIENNLIYNNSSRDGAGIGCLNGNTGTMVNNTIYNNNASRDGGGIYIMGTETAVNSFNNVLWNNSAITSGDQIEVNSGSITVTYSDVAGGYTGTGNINSDPFFNDPNNADFTFEANSPLVDSGTNTGAPSTDIDGNSRPFDGDRDATAVVDIGAYEYTNTVPVITTTAVTSVDEDQPYTYDVDADDPDADEILTYSLAAGPLFLSINSATGEIAGLPDNDDVGSYPVTVVVTDLNGATDTQPFTLTVNQVNDPPVVGDIPGEIINEGEIFAPILLDNFVDDVDNPDEEISWVPSGMVNLDVDINPSTRIAVITVLNVNWNGSETITFTATDGEFMDSDDATFTVNPVNDLPLAVDDAAGTNEDVAVVINVLSNDSDIDGVLVPSSVIVTNDPTNGGTSINTTTGEITYTPAADWFGEDTFTYTVEDDSGAVSNEATVTVTVSSVNDAPVAVDDAAGTNEDVAVVINVLSNDSDIDGVLVPSSVIVTNDPTNGGTSINTTTGEITYTPAADWFGEDTFTYTVEDDSGAVSNEATVTVTVSSVNDAPVAVDDAAGTNEDVAVVINVLSNDSDSDGVLVPSSVVVTGGPSNGGTSVNTTTGAITYTPTTGWNGVDTFTYTVEDDSGAVSNAATVNIAVGSVNDFPIAVDDAAGTNEEVAVIIDVLVNDSDSDGVLVPSSVTVINDPTNGGTSVNTTTGAVTYTPVADWFGEDTFTYTVEDDSGAVSNEATVTVTVNSVNDAPVAVDDVANTNEDAAVVINVLSNDSDIDGVLVPSSVTVTGGPTNGGTSVNTSTGEITYTPTTGWNGVDTFTYTVEDDSSAVSNEATVTVTVGSVNDPPVAVDDAAATNEEVAVIIDVLANDTDSDGVLVPSSVTVTNDPGNGGTSVNTTTGAVTYTPNPEFNGIDIFTYTVEDDSGAVSNEATATITVNSVNDPPVISQLPELAFNEDDSLVYPISNLYDYVTDPDNPDSVLIYTLNIGNHVTVIPDSPNVILRAPANWFGPDTLELIVSDGELSDTAQVFVTVNPINDAPEFVNWPDTVQFTDLSDTVLTMIGYVNDIDSPDTSLTWQFSVSNDTLNLQFNEGTTELTLTAPGFIGIITLYCTVTDDSSASIQDSFTVKVIADPTGIDDFVTQIPEKYFLNQNYPNPFNPVTKIKYALPKSGTVNIEVYNIIGQKVAKLLNEFKPAGYHIINFDGSNLPSGVYFYRIQTEGFNSVKKMVLIK